MNTNTWIGVGVVVLLVGSIAAYAFSNNVSQRPGEHDQLAQCIADAGAKFYGAYWCPHCQNQKALFGNSARLLPYVECSSADGRTQLPVCAQAEVESYPTWIFADGSRLEGEVSPEVLAQKTSCAVTEGATPTVAPEEGATSPVVETSEETSLPKVE